MLTAAQHNQFRDEYRAKMQRSSPPGVWDRYNAAMAHFKATGRPLNAQGGSTGISEPERKRIIQEANLTAIFVRMDVERVLGRV